MVFKRYVLSVFAPVLSRYGFVGRKGGGGVFFERRLRGYENTILVESRGDIVPGSKITGYTLYAPKWPWGASGGELPGQKRWWDYAGEAELICALQEMARDIEQFGLTWFETYTPGNVPEWEHDIDIHVLPILGPLGFYRSKPDEIPDMAVYKHVSLGDSRVGVDMRIPGTVSVGFIGRGPNFPLTDIKKGPELKYSGPTDFKQIFMQLAEFLRVEVPRWFEL